MGRTLNCVFRGGKIYRLRGEKKVERGSEQFEYCFSWSVSFLPAVRSRGPFKVTFQLRIKGFAMRVVVDSLHYVRVTQFFDSYLFQKLTHVLERAQP